MSSSSGGRYRVLISLISIGILHSCSRENTGWDTGLLVPLAETSLSISELIPDSMLETQAGSPVLIRYERILSLIPLDSVVRIPDTTLIQHYSVPFSFNLPAGFQLSGINDLVRFNYKDLQIAEAEILEGSAFLRFENRLTDRVYYDYLIPKAILNGASIGISNELVGPGEFVERTVDFAGTRLNLRGDNNNAFNQLRIRMNARLNPFGSGVSVGGGDTLVSYYNRFSGLKPRYVRGFLGTEQFSTTGVGEIDFLKKIKGSFRPEELSLSLELENSIGADFGLNIGELRGVNVESGSSENLRHEIIGREHIISRARSQSNGTLPYSPSTKKFELNSSNSNILDFISIIPNQIHYSVNARINPLGNISGGNDFIYNTSNARVKLLLEAPLRFSANQLSFTDTLNFEGLDGEILDPVQQGELTVSATNGFPLSFDLQVHLLDSTGYQLSILLPEQRIKPAQTNANQQVITPTVSDLKILLSQENKHSLVNARYIVVKATVNSENGELITIYPEQKLHLKLRGKGIYRIGIR